MPNRFRSGLRRGPKFEITFEMAVTNLRAVAQRLGVTTLSVRQYCRHGSYHSRNLTKKWPWRVLCQAAGLTCQHRPGRPRRTRRTCLECAQRQSRTVGPHCPTCHRRICRLSGGMEAYG